MGREARHWPVERSGEKSKMKKENYETPRTPLVVEVVGVTMVGVVLVAEKVGSQPLR